MFNNLIAFKFPELKHKECSTVNNNFHYAFTIFSACGNILAYLIYDYERKLCVYRNSFRSKENMNLKIPKSIKM